MEIVYFGQAAFKLKGREATVVIDPFEKSFEKKLGFSLPKIEAEIVISSHCHPDHSGVDRVQGSKKRNKPLVIDAPGEYEAEGVSVFGIASFHDDKQGKQRGKNTIFVIHLDDLSVAHLGDLGHMLTQKQVEEINGVDVLMVPVGGVYTIGPQEAVKVVDQVEPSIVIPMHYKFSADKGLDKLLPVDDFLKEAGAEGARQEKKLVVSKAALPEDREIVVLER